MFSVICRILHLEPFGIAIHPSICSLLVRPLFARPPDGRTDSLHWLSQSVPRNIHLEKCSAFIRTSVSTMSRKLVSGSIRTEVQTPAFENVFISIVVVSSQTTSPNGNGRLSRHPRDSLFQFFENVEPLLNRHLGTWNTMDPLYSMQGCFSRCFPAVHEHGAVTPGCLPVARSPVEANEFRTMAETGVRYYIRCFEAIERLQRPEFE